MYKISTSYLGIDERNRLLYSLAMMFWGIKSRSIPGLFFSRNNLPQLTPSPNLATGKDHTRHTSCGQPQNNGAYAHKQALWSRLVSLGTRSGW